MKDDLKYIFSNINDWLKFAEAKNAGILALNAACIIGILQANIGFDPEAPSSTRNPILTGLLISFFLLSSIVCIISIVPYLQSTVRLFQKLDESTFQQNKKHLNHLFFGHIATLTSDQYLELITSKTGTGITSESERDLIQQVIMNSEIALQKFRYFAIASWITFGAATLGMILLLIRIIT